MKPQTANPTQQSPHESLLRRLARKLGFGRKRRQEPVRLGIDGMTTDKKTDPWGGPPPM
jgi:hypothetical protein